MIMKMVRKIVLHAPTSQYDHNKIDEDDADAHLKL